ncbi:c-type cytochrome [Methylomicrobium sp. RS1]|uniref:c-type cytochrome n=1 Tax=Candidatus Methylomicrobium oryzae TaxID=2802053 RepID=UPI001924DCDD|nr:c-type cytochrome [Methylomicrobium sp. RS1]MBL1262544.1 c-type cytochrome [Methylomicrobium sp. RS1]
MFSLKHSVSVCLVLAYAYSVPTPAADAAAGAEKAAMCVGCHGPNGKSSNPQWPNLAAQQPDYMAAQLKAFKSGARKNPMMQSMAANLSDQDIENLAAYFAAQPAAKAGGDTALAKTGAEKAGTCLHCHGAQGQGITQIPRLAGQHPGYLEAQLKHFKEGSRQGGPMQGMASALSDDDIKALSAYFGSL